MVGGGVRPDVGWAIGDGREHGDDPAWDAAEADALYDLARTQVVPEFYERNESRDSPKWVARMRESMARLTPAYSANRTVREYTENHYLPAAAAYAARAGQKGRLGVELLEWQRKLATGWHRLAFGPLKVESNDKGHHFEVIVYLGDLDPDAVQVELFADPHNGDKPVRKPMGRGARQSDGGFVYSATTEIGRSPNDFTPRVVPCHSAASIPLEATQILWQK